MSTVDLPADPAAFTAEAFRRGWTDGLPVIPPTPELVASFVAAGGGDADDAIADLPPSGAPCTVGALAANAVMAGAPASSMPLLRAAIEAMTEPDFDLHALNATTAPVVPAIVVNGPVRHALDIPFGAGCLGGVAGPAPAIGRAIRLVMRNVARQEIGVTSQSVFGTPGRVAGIVFGEWEERSPWAPLAARRGVEGDAVTVYGAMGTANVVDVVADDGPALLEIIGRSLAYPGASGFASTAAFSEVLVAINPIWAALIAEAVPAIEDVQERLWHHAALPLSWWPAPHRRAIEAVGRVRDDGRVHLVERPDQVLVVVCGGLGGLHAAPIHSFGPTLTITRPVG